MITLLDNTVMSNFALVKHPDMLHIAFGDTLATPQQAFEELKVGVRVGKLPDLDWQWLPVWTLEKAEIPRYHQFLRSLNAGEAACLAIAITRGCRILTDDRDARELARSLRIPLSGTLGVLVRLVDIGYLSQDEADTLLLQMIAAGYHSPVTSLREIICLSFRKIFIDTDISHVCN
jgi:predicted nucleic acid-binding protein